MLSLLEQVSLGRLSAALFGLLIEEFFVEGLRAIRGSLDSSVDGGCDGDSGYQLIMKPKTDGDDLRSMPSEREA